MDSVSCIIPRAALPRRPQRILSLFLSISLLFVGAVVFRDGNGGNLRRSTAVPSKLQPDDSRNLGLNNNNDNDDNSNVAAWLTRELQVEEDSATVMFGNMSKDAFCEANCPAPEEPALEASWISAVPFGIQIIMIIVLILLSALFSGLTLGLMGLDKTGLEIVMEGDDLVNAAAAKKIYPVREKGNLLLCTLLLGNVAVNALLSILLADKAGGAVGFIASTFLIVIFGEILPQALCSRHALWIGSRTIPLVIVIRFILYPIAWPLAFLLDLALGEELATTYGSTEMMKMLQIHVQENMLDQDTAVVMTGALKYKDMCVEEVMTPLKNTFMLSVDETLNFETIAAIFKTGYSRIPVYEVTKNNVIGLLFVKDLIFIDPEDETPIRKFIQVFGRGVHVVWPVDKLGEVLRDLKTGKSHMALVRDVVSDGDTDPFYVILGIITLEDIVEEILGHEIVDETDAFVDGTHEEKVSRAEGFEWAKLRLLGSKIVDQRLTHTEARAITAHLKANYPKAVAPLTDDLLQKLVADTVVTVLPTATRELGNDLPNDLLYEKGVPNNVCTLVLSGKITVITGADEFRTDVSSWTLLGMSALRDPSYEPDFTAFVCKGPCRCLQFTRENFNEAVSSLAVKEHSMQDNSSKEQEHSMQDSSSKRLSLEKHQQNGSQTEGISPAPSASEEEGFERPLSSDVLEDQ